MINNMSLIEDEAVIKEFSFRHSVTMFFLKSQLVLTNKRFLGKINNTFWIIPVGANNFTQSLNDIAEVRLEKKLNIKSLVFSLLIVVMGLVSLHVHSSIHLGVVLVLLGKVGIMSSRQKLIVVQDNSGASMSCSISRSGVTKANELMNAINNTIAARG